jgi:predicted alpha/beta hydrolase family esterase
MKNALILHGTFGNSKENWFPWLEKQLVQKGWHVWVPDLPGAESPNIETYNNFIFPKWNFNEESIIIGHSSGAVAAFGLLQEFKGNVNIDKVFSVAGFTNDLDWDPLRELFRYEFNWPKIKNSVNKSVLFQSDNDPYVSFDHAQRLKELLSAELVVIKGQGHFSIGSDPKYTEFPELLEKILE